MPKKVKNEFNPNWIIALLIIIITSIGLPYLFNIEKNSAFVISSLLALLYLLGVDS